MGPPRDADRGASRRSEHTWLDARKPVTTVIMGLEMIRMPGWRLVMCGVVLQAAALAVVATEPTAPARGQALDGRHDFDFSVGVWHTHVRHILDPLSGSSDSEELDGTVTTRRIWGGRAFLEEIEADSPQRHWEALSLFLYNPGSRQWSQSFINSRLGTLGPPLIGSFKNGRGELFTEDTFHDRSILVRGVWSNITPASHTYEESISNDGGKTWAPSFIANKTREQKESTSDIAAGSKPMSAAPEEHEFDFDFGTWKTRSSRLLQPLTGSKDWVDFDGYTTVRKVWNGRAGLAEYKVAGRSGVVELLSLRWFNPSTHEWNIDFAASTHGTLETPGVGGFKNGRADFYDYEPVNGRSVLRRFSIWGITPETVQSEEAFSDDGGQTWEVDWINHYARVKSK